MLRALLERMRSGDTTSQTHLAQQMGIDLSTLDRLIQQLVQLGYLEVVTLDCETGATCSHCDVRVGGCAQPLKMWHLTEKGINASR